jgi:hypothetical protein
MMKGKLSPEARATKALLRTARTALQEASVVSRKGTAVDATIQVDRAAAHVDEALRALKRSVPEHGWSW